MVKKTSLSLKASDVIAARYWIFLGALILGALFVEKGSGVMWINGHHDPFLDNFFKSITRLGEGIVFVPIIIITLFIQFRYTAMVAILLSGNGLLVTICKHVLFSGLERPRAFLGDELIYFVPGVDVHSVNTFPSGHTATAFGAALFVSLLSRNKKIGTLSLMMAALVGYSRIYLAQHFFADVIAGATIGILTTFTVWRTLEYNRGPKWMTRRLHIPGDSTQTGRGNTAGNGT